MKKRCRELRKGTFSTIKTYLRKVFCGYNTNEDNSRIEDEDEVYRWNKHSKTKPSLFY